MKFLKYFLFIVFVLYVVGSISDKKESISDEKEYSDRKSKSYPSSDSDYAAVSYNSGCESKFSKQKKEKIFESNFKNHWFTWTGIVKIAENDSVSLNMDNGLLQDVSIDLKDKNAGYDILLESKITVRFLMKSEGGCLLPFGGVNGVIIK